MNFIHLLQTIFLGLIEGITEFLPISSTAHLIIIGKIIHFQSFNNYLFEISIQLGAIMAVCLYYYSKLLKIVTNFHNNKESRLFIINIIISTIPTLIIGGIFYNFIKQYLFSIHIIIFSLFIGGIIIIIVEKKLNIQPKYTNINAISFKTSFLIGLGQTLALIPGTSRAGSTIVSGLLLKLDRKTSLEFSFFLAIPIIFAATIYDIYKNFSLITLENILFLIIGFFVSFISALITIKYLLKYIQRHNLAIFGYYRIFLALLLGLTLL